KELKKRDEEIASNLIPEITKVVKIIGEKDDYTVIMHERYDDIPYSKNSDITNIIIAEFDYYIRTNQVRDSSTRKKLSPVFENNSSKISFFNLTVVLQQSEVGKKAAQELKKLYEEKSAMVKDAEKELKISKDYSRNSDYQKKFKDYQDLVDGANKELKKRDEEIASNLIPEIMKIVETIKKEDNYTAIVDLTTVAYSKKDKDITDKIIYKFNQYAKMNLTPDQRITVNSSAALDKGQPEITITQPDVQRGIKVVAKKESITVIGKATDKGGVALVEVNGEKASLDENGNFSVDILLKVGENNITVTATNIYRIEKTERFSIVREADVIATSKSIISANTDLPEASTNIKTGKYYALIIGNNDYMYLSKLHMAINDAKDVAKILKDNFGFETKVITNAKRKDILSNLNNFRRKLGTNDNFLIYYAGHGEFDKASDKAYWLPVDAKRDDPTEWIIADEITSSIKRLSSRHVLVVSDSCYSGTLARSIETDLSKKGPRGEFIKKMLKRPSRTLMASGGNEPVSDSGGMGNSIFADSLIKALNNIEHKTFTADELFYHQVRSRVAGKSEQVPEYKEIRNSGHEGGDFIFVKVR
ncbi:MAG TPA: caspase family protein, partial [Smithellaceae bacterium]|nr:caspase family protein [Smithellaceae bacterium]